MKLDRISKEANKLSKEKRALEDAMKKESEVKDSLLIEVATTKNALENLKRSMADKLSEIQTCREEIASLKNEVKFVKTEKELLKQERDNLLRSLDGNAPVDTKAQKMAALDISKLKEMN